MSLTDSSASASAVQFFEWLWGNIQVNNFSWYFHFQWFLKKNCKSAESWENGQYPPLCCHLPPECLWGIWPTSSAKWRSSVVFVAEMHDSNSWKEKDPYTVRLLDCARGSEKYQLTNGGWLISGRLRGRRDMDDWWRREVWEITYSKKRRGKEENGERCRRGSDANG